MTKVVYFDIFYESIWLRIMNWTSNGNKSDIIFWEIFNKQVKSVSFSVNDFWYKKDRWISCSRVELINYWRPNGLFSGKEAVTVTSGSWSWVSSAFTSAKLARKARKGKKERGRMIEFVRTELTLATSSLIFLFVPWASIFGLTVTAEILRSGILSQRLSQLNTII